MFFVTYIFLITQIIFTIAEPIDGGKDVGKIKVHEGKQIVLNPANYPYVVHLHFDIIEVEGNPKRYYEIHMYCAGVLITENVILSAAHCLKNHRKRPRRITAWLGILDTVLDQGKGQEILVRGYTCHNSYAEGSTFQYINDILLLWLRYPAILDDKYVKVAKLPTDDFVAEKKSGFIVGWGTQSCGRKMTMLQEAVVRGVSPAKCQKYYKKTKIAPNLICVMADNKKRTSTRGDSGGPFVIRDTVVGISSFGAVDWEKSDVTKGIIACDAKKPAAYTYVPKYLDWIAASLADGPQINLLKSKPESTLLLQTSTLIPGVPPKRPSRRPKL